MQVSKLIEHCSIIALMIQIYVELLLSNQIPDRAQRIQRALLKRGVSLATGSLTTRSLAAAITTTVCYAFSLNVSIERVLLRFSARAVTITGLYGYMQEAAYEANKLKQMNSIFYNALYAEKLEMMYFLIESVISRNSPLMQILSTEDAIADAFMRITQ